MRTSCACCARTRWAPGVRRAGRTEGRVLVRHYGGLIPDEIVLTPVMFLKVQDLLCVSETWGTASLGGCTWRLTETVPEA